MFGFVFVFVLVCVKGDWVYCAFSRASLVLRMLLLHDQQEGKKGPLRSTVPKVVLQHHKTDATKRNPHHALHRVPVDRAMVCDFSCDIIDIFSPDIRENTTYSLC